MLLKFQKVIILIPAVTSTIITFAFLVTANEKSTVVDHTWILYFKNLFDLNVSIKYKIRLLKAQVLKSYRTFVIQKSYGAGGGGVVEQFCPLQTKIGLNPYGCSLSAPKLMQTYLTERKQRVKINQAYSSWKENSLRCNPRIYTWSNFI